MIFNAGNIGGIANLFIGISILTLGEIVEIIIYLFVTIYRHYKTERTVGILTQAQDRSFEPYDDNREDNREILSIRPSTGISWKTNSSM